MVISQLPVVLIKYLLLTIMVEVLVAIIIGIRRKKDIINVILVNVVTNPLLNSLQIFFGYRYGIKARNISLLVLEILAFLFEGFIYHRFLENKKMNGYLVSLILNLCSYLIGEVINTLQL